MTSDMPQNLSIPQLNDLQQYTSDPLVQAANSVLSREFEALNGGTLLPIDAYLDFLKRSCTAIARIRRNPLDKLSGTGFLMQGAAISPKWAGKVLLVTNWHVINPIPSNNSFLPQDARAEFDETHNKLAVPAGRYLWGSDYQSHDCSILELSNASVPGLSPFDRIDASFPNPAEKADGSAIGEVMPIGYPLGQKLQVSAVQLGWQSLQALPIQSGTARIDRSMMYYRSPTDGGSSGSPVFNRENMGLIGLHHAACSVVVRRTLRLAKQDRPPRYSTYRNRRSPAGASATSFEEFECEEVVPMNEGIWLESIRTAIAQAPGGVGLGAQAGAGMA
jgi:hypothetical protein